MSDDIHDTSRVDSYLRARRKVALLNAAWRPMLAGAAGAALVIAAVWVTLPKVSYREVEVPKIVTRDAVVPNIVTRDVTVDHIVPHDVEVNIPRIVAASPAPRSPEEQAFIDRPDYQSTDYHGRIVSPREARALSFDNGADFFPVDATQANDSSDLIGALGFCNKDQTGPYWHCFAIKDDVVRPVTQKSAVEHKS